MGIHLRFGTAPFFILLLLAQHFFVQFFAGGYVGMLYFIHRLHNEMCHYDSGDCCEYLFHKLLISC